MENLSKLDLVKRHLGKIKSRTEKLTGFAGHLSSKYSLDSFIEKEDKPAKAAAKYHQVLHHA